MLWDQPLRDLGTLPTVPGKLRFLRCIHRIWPLFAQCSEEITDIYKWNKSFRRNFLHTYRMRAPFPVVCQLHPLVCCGLHLFALVILYLLIKNETSVTTIRCICQHNHCWQGIIRFSFVPVVYLFRIAAALFVAQNPQLSKPASSLTVTPMTTSDEYQKKRAGGDLSLVLSLSGQTLSSEPTKTKFSKIQRPQASKLEGRQEQTGQSQKTNCILCSQYLLCLYLPATGPQQG